MSESKSGQSSAATVAKANSKATQKDRTQPPADHETKPVEVGGRDGLDPVRYGDWEKGGRCIDF